SRFVTLSSSIPCLESLSCPSRRSSVLLAVHLLMVFAITLMWMARRTDSIFGWLFLLGAGSLFNVITSSALMPQALQSLQPYVIRSEEHTSELQSREKLVCRPLLEKKTI